MHWQVEIFWRLLSSCSAVLDPRKYLRCFLANFAASLSFLIQQLQPMAKQDQIPGLHCPLPLSNLKHKGFWFRTTNSTRFAQWVWSENAAQRSVPTHRVPNLLGWHSRFNSTICLYEFYESNHKQITLRNNNDRTTGQLIKCHHVLEGLFTCLLNAPKLGNEIFHWGSDHRAYVQLWLQHPATLWQHPCADCLLRPKRDFDLKDVHHDIWHHWDLLISFKWKTRRFRIWNSIWIKALSHAATSLDFVGFCLMLGLAMTAIRAWDHRHSSHPPGLEHPAASEQVKPAHRMKQWTKASALTRCQHQWHIDAQQLQQRMVQLAEYSKC